MPASTHNQVFIATPDAQLDEMIRQILQPVGCTVVAHSDLASLKIDMGLLEPAMLLLAEDLPDGSGLEFAAETSSRYPLLPLVLLTAKAGEPATLRAAAQSGISEFAALPLDPVELLAATRRSLARGQQRRDWLAANAKPDSSALGRQVDELETLSRLGRAVTSSLNLDNVLTSIVDAAVQLTGAEEGSLLLLDESTGELYVRAARNFNEEFVRSFRLPISDTLAGRVLRSGEPVLLNETTPQKIKTSYLVHSLLYVPLQRNGQTFGVLGVDNRLKRQAFNDDHLRLLAAMADYATIAIENARLYNSQSAERARLETILTHTQDGFIVIDADRRLVLVNRAAQEAFDLGDSGYTGKRFAEVFTQPDLLEIVESPATIISRRVELGLPDGRIFSALLAPIPEIGAAVTLHDITYLKNLDRMKSDFVSTVSHDLRSPLTAVLGYVELIERAGPVTEMQREFIRRVQGSVHNITRLVDDLVNLGRIESGFDMRKETLDLTRIIQYAAEGFKKQVAERNQRLLLDLPENLPAVVGNPVQLRQVIDHLLDNAMRYTAAGGIIGVRARSEDQQLIIQVRDTGIGIPQVDLPFIFDKFYRAANASGAAPGTGLGLAIVRSVIESHRGRIWVDSVINKGTEFTIVLPEVQAA